MSTITKGMLFSVANFLKARTAFLFLIAFGLLPYQYCPLLSMWSLYCPFESLSTKYKFLTESFSAEGVSVESVFSTKDFIRCADSEYCLRKYLTLCDHVRPSRLRPRTLRSSNFLSMDFLNSISEIFTRLSSLSKQPIEFDQIG